MGSTDSKSKPSLQKQYRLIRKFVATLYGGTQVTVIEHKQTQQQFVLRQFVQQFSPQLLVSQLETHRSLSHRNLIQLRRYWIEHDVNLCSSLFKIYAVFDHHETSLEEYQGDGKKLSDREVADFVRQMTAILTFLERNKVFFLLAGPRSIAVSAEQQESLREISPLNNQQHHKSVSRFKGEQCEKQVRRSLAGGDYMKTGDKRRTSLRKQSFSSLPSTSKRIYKIFDPLDGLSCHKSILKLDSFLQVPAHPSILNTNQYVMLSDSLVRQQNNLTVGLIAATLCQGCDFGQLDVFKNSRMSLHKYGKYIEKLKTSFPKTARELEKSQNLLSHLNGPIQMSQGLKIKDMSLMKRRKQSKENISIEGKWHEGGKENQSEGLSFGSSCKRISLCHI